MVTETCDWHYSTEKRNNSSEINITINTRFSALSYVNGTLTLSLLNDC